MTMWGIPEREGALCCHACWGVYVDTLPEDAPFYLRFLPRMLLCPFCGNKRCPKATNHMHGCTGSNESGQEGSRYAHTNNTRRTLL